MSIYTKKGDRGETGLFRKVDGKSVRVSKSSCNTRAIGAVDEIDSYLGIIASEIKIPPFALRASRGRQNSKIKDTIQKSKIKRIQDNLLTIGSILAGSDLKLKAGETKRLEKEIDEIDKTLPKLTNFIYPGGCPIAAKLQYARTLARRAEREVVAFSEESKVSANILKYLNRLSDYLFTLARAENQKSGVKDVIWMK